ncbi:MAG: protease modulator HflC [Candidatus Auribacterota bacterium]|nr:protease modulator HflC [Candidatus Auribacterota bacterium]
MKKNFLTIFVGILIAILLLLYLVAFQLSVNEKAVLTTFGKPTRTLDKPGLYWKLPWPFQKVYSFDARLIIDESVFEETLTSDGKNIVFSTCLGWRIKNPKIFLESIGSINDAKRNLEGLVRTFKSGVIGRHEFANLISLDNDSIQFEQIEREMLQPVAHEAQDRYGIQVDFLYITRIALPEQTTAKVFERMKKERERIAERFRAEGDALANEIKSKARSERDQILARAEAKAKKIRGEGDAAAAEYYRIFEDNKKLAVFLQKLETLEQVLKNKATVILDTQTPPFDLLDSIDGQSKP